MENIINYLKTLINFQTITPEGFGATEHIKNLLSDHGFSTDIQIFGNKDYKVTNLYAVYGSKKPNICFAGHIDVVPPGSVEKWKTDPFTATIIDNKIYGRGTVDMKGAIACTLSASLDFIKLNPNPKGSISFLITSDEEGEGKYGTKKMLKYLKDKGHSIDLAILGEPTSEKEVGDTIKIGRRGSINIALTVKGEQGHVAYPELADNPVHALVKIIYDLITLQLDQGSRFFQSSHLEVTSIDVGNVVANVIPYEASARFNVRFNDLHSADTIIDMVEQVVSKYSSSYSLTSQSNAEAFIQKPAGLIADFVNIVEKTLGIRPELSTGGGTSDSRFIKDYCPVVEFGLLSKMAHKIDEYTEISDLQSLYNVYYYFLNKLLG